MPCLDASTTTSPSPSPSYIVGIGASAGGLEALEAFFRHMPVASGLTFVIVQHLSPTFKSLMDELLARYTTIAIEIAEDGLCMAPNTVYLMPANTEMTLSGGRLRLSDRNPDASLSLPIDRFFESLAAELGDRAIGIILSGTGSDGSRGIRDIHNAGGLVVVQDSHSAKFDGMPRSAFDTGLADMVLAPEQMPEALLTYVADPLTGRHLLPGVTDSNVPPLDILFQLLRERYGVDFTHYKSNTITRRIERRLSLDHGQALPEYVAHLADHLDELNTLSPLRKGGGTSSPCS